MTRTYLFLLIQLLGLAACTDDLARTDTPQPGPGEGLISLSLPGIVYDNADPTATRTQTDDDEADATRDERRVTSLWFMAYPTTDGGGETLVQLLRPSDNELTHDYKTFHIRIKAGTYKIYVVANMPEIGPTYTEQQLKDCILSYRNGTGQNATLVLPSPKSASGLPMVYESTNAVTITAAQSEPITADLVFTCVKVRCTLWFDNTTGGHSHNVFGNNYLLMQDITGRNIATQAPLLPTEQAIEGMELLCTAEDALNGLYADDEYSEDAHETLDFTSNNPHAKGQWAYRTTFYLPEHYVKQNSAQSYLDITAALHDATGVKKANVAYTLPLGDEPTTDDDLRQLPRGKYYDIVGKIVNLGGEIESTVAIMDWTPKEVNTELESPYHLWVEKTEIGTEDKPLKAGDSISIALRTDAPTLTTEQTKVTIGGKEIDPYILTLNKDSETGAYTSVSIEVNPELAPGSNVPDDAKKFYIVMHNHDGDAILKKEIKITELSLEPYLIVTPEQYIIRISDIGNLPEHTVIFSYETNLTEVNVKCGDETITTDGISWSENPNVTITDSGLQDGKGTVSVTLDTPYDPAAYPTLQTVVLDYEATGTHKPDASTTEETITLTDQTTVTIIPNAQTYRLHFRPVDDSWTNPHIYVYEPLYAPDGTEVLITGGRGQIYNGQIKDFWGTPNTNTSSEDCDLLGENALQYSFTGKRTFLGWQGEGGTIETPQTYYYNGNEHYWDGDYYFSLKYLQFDNWNNGSGARSAYNWDIDYVAQEFRNECSECNMSAPKGHNNVDTNNPSDGYNYKWPGVAMKEDKENPGWFYFDLPALAEPGKALIMFADGHDGPANNDPQKRYPAHMVPGVPLYDYADKDGWFLYDYQKGDDNGFVDDKPNIADKDMVIYRIYVNNSSAKGLHVWIENGNADIPLTNYNTAAGGNLGTDSQGRKYIELYAIGETQPRQLGYIVFYDNGSNSGNQYTNNWTSVTENTYEYTIN